MRQEALEVLTRLSAEGTIAIFGVLISTASPFPINSLLLGATPSLTGRPQEPSERARLETELGARLKDPALKAEAVRMGVLDASDTPKWQEWIRDNQELMAEWSERDLTKVRQRLSRKSTP